MQKYCVYARLLAVRALVLALLAVLASWGLWLSSRGDALRAYKRARANGEYDNPSTCPSLEQHQEQRLVSAELDEISGMAVSQRQPELLWVHNDSGDRARIFAIKRDGSLRAELLLDGVEARDFEDIAIQGDQIYIADTGNNLKTRSSVAVLVLPEPPLPKQGVATLHRKPRRVEITYEDGRHDVEAMFVDGRGDVYLVNKAHLLNYIERSGVYRVSAAEMKNERAVARKVSSLEIGPATAASLSADGRTLAVRNYFIAMWWQLAEGESPVQAFARQPCRFWLHETSVQGESLTLLPDGTGFLTLAEGEHAQLLYYQYRAPEPAR